MRCLGTDRGMGGGWRVWACLVAMASVAACQMAAPARDCASASPSSSPVLNSLAPARPGMSGRVFREIRDPHSGARWLIVQDARHPAGPGLLLSATGLAAAGAVSAPGEQGFLAVIHRGDRVVVEEHTAAAESYLESVALSGAPAGCALEVRLKIGGKVVRAVAMAPGRASLMPAQEAQP